MRVAISPRSFRQVPGRHQELLAETGFEPTYPTVNRHLTEDEMVELVADCQALIVGIDPVSARVMDSGPLHVIVKYGSGLDNIDLEAAQAREISVRSTPGANAHAVAELALAMLLALARTVVTHHLAAFEGRWERWMGIEVAGKRLGIVGLGQVGSRAARIAEAIGMEVVGYDPYADDLSVPNVDLETLLATSWAVSLHVPLTPETRHMIGRDQLALMPRGAMLVNTARGGLVDEAAVAEALASGQLAGAAFDDFEERPSPDSPLWGYRGFVASPHAGAATQESVERTGTAAVEAILEELER